MKAVIYKYIVKPVLGIQSITIPQEAKFLKADTQINAIVLWYLIPLNMLETSDIRKLSLEFTGRLFNHDVLDVYLETVTLSGLIWHIFDITNRENNL
jgi:hypothetical protein